MAMCAFCPKAASPMALEHLWGAWIGRLFPGYAFEWRAVDPLNSTVTTGSTMKLDLKVEAVCQKCNHEWMSGLESQIQPLLSRIIRDGESMYFSKRDLQKLAAFTFKSAVIANYLNPAREPFFTRASRERFRISRQIPGAVSCWFAGLSTSVMTGSYLSYVLGFQIPANNGVWNDLEMNVFTFAAGYLVLQLRAFRYASLAHRGRPLPRKVSQKAFWDVYSTPFFPIQGSMLRWPPTEHLSDDLFGMFAHRWEGAVRIIPGVS